MYKLLRICFKQTIFNFTDDHEKIEFCMQEYTQFTPSHPWIKNWILKKWSKPVSLHHSCTQTETIVYQGVHYPAKKLNIDII